MSTAAATGGNRRRNSSPTFSFRGHMPIKKTAPTDDKLASERIDTRIAELGD
jgi:hypothetical protein